MTVTACMEAWFIGHGLPVHHHLRGESRPPAVTRYGLTKGRLSIRESFFKVQSKMVRLFFFHQLLQNVYKYGPVYHDRPPQAIPVFTSSKSTLFNFARQLLVGTAFFCPCVEPSNDATRNMRTFNFTLLALFSSIAMIGAAPSRRDDLYVV